MADPDTMAGDLDDVGDGFGAGYAFVERMFVIALRNGVKVMKAEPERWKRVFRLLDESEVDRVAAWFATRAPTIRAGYATLRDPLPCVSVALAMEAPRSDGGEFLGDLLEHGVSAREFGKGFTGEARGTIDRQEIDVTIWADHPDVALYLYHWTKYVLRAHVGWFLRQGVVDPSFVTGGDVQPDPRFVPENVYSRLQKWHCSGESASVEPMADPPTRLHLHLQTVTVEGMVGGVGAVSDDVPDDGQ